MLAGVRRYSTQLTELSAMSLAVGLMLSLSILSNAGQSIDTSDFPSTEKVLNSSTGRTIRVEGYGDAAPEGVGNSLQSAEAVNQSGDVDKTLQNPKSGDDIQPNSGQSDF